MIPITKVVAGVKTRVGRRNLPRVDKLKVLLVIFILWFPELLDPWLLNWNEGLIPNLFEDAHLMTSVFYNVNIMIVFVFKCAFCIVLSFSTDLHGGKYPVFVLCLCIYLITPVLGLFIYSFQLARSTVLISLGLSFKYICYPVKLCAIFSQMPHPSNKWSRLLSSLFLISVCISTNLAMRSFPIPYPHVILILITWSVVLLGFMVLLPLSICLKKFVRREEVKEHSVKRILIGIRTDIKTDIENNDIICCGVSKNTLKIIIFFILLIPILISTAVCDHIDQINGDDLGPNLGDATMNMVDFYGFVAIPLGGVILLLVSKLSEKTAGILNLGLPHLILLAAASFIFIDFNFEFNLQIIELDSLVDERDSMRELVGPIPARRSAIYAFYNFFHEPVRVNSKLFNVLVKTDCRETARVINKLYTFDLELSVTNPNYNSITFQAAGNFDEITSYIIKGNATSLKLLDVSGSEWVRPVKSPILVIMNTFVKNEEKINRLEVKDKKSNASSIITVKDATKSTWLHVSASSLKISYYTLDKVGNRHPRLLEDFETQQYSVYAMIIDKDYRNYSYYLQSYLIMQLIADEEMMKHKVPKYVYNHRPVALIAFRLYGAALTLMRVGTIHHFWTEAPLRLRTTVLAVFFVAMSVIDRLVRSNLSHFGKKESYLILILQLFSTLWHLLFSGIYYYGLKKPREPDLPTGGDDLRIVHSITFKDSAVIQSISEYQDIPSVQYPPLNHNSNSHDLLRESKTWNESSTEPQLKGSKELPLADNTPTLPLSPSTQPPPPQ